jgi:hypothetical protein
MSSLCSQFPVGGGIKQKHIASTLARVCFFVPFHSLKQAWLISGHKKSRQAGYVFLFGGERGIRTPGGLTLNGFQDRRNRPLCHLSGGEINAYLLASCIAF